VVTLETVKKHVSHIFDKLDQPRPASVHTPIQ
jgi:DNA-binding NarL/FixJ family response regulator